MRTLIAGVGYSNLRDMSLGPILTPQLAAMDWPVDIEVDDLSFGPIAVVQRFQTLAEPYHRVILFSAVSRGHTPGTVTTYLWEHKLPPPDEIQARIGEAVTGVVGLDNLLIIGEHFGIWPEDIIVIEVEPTDEGEDGWGPGFSPAVAKAVDDVLATVRRVALGRLAEAVT
ncbi:MAG: hydrogenase maturation protease [Anaerolineales bacterium]